MKKLKALQQNNDGMTMVEVLMGFLILSIILGGVVSLISFSSKMYFNSVDLRRDQTELVENAYKKEIPGKVSVTNTNSGYVKDASVASPEPITTLSGVQVGFKDMELYSIKNGDIDVYVYVSTVTPEPTP